MGHNILSLYPLGGYELLVRAAAGPVVMELDLISLMGDMGIDNEVPNERSDFGKFRRKEILAGRQFDLIFCDCQVLRNHMKNATDHRQQREATRLTRSQFLTALRRVAVGGTIVIRLHKMDAWETALTLRAVDQFASIQVFKPTVGHCDDSSFYLVAKDVQPGHEEALKAIIAWSKSWKEATFGREGAEVQGEAAPESVSMGKVTEDQVTEFLDEYGTRLATLGDDTWKIQKDAIDNADWFKEGKMQEEEKKGTLNEGSHSWSGADANLRITK